MIYHFLGIPSQPTAFGLKELRGSIAIFYWERGFNGGHKQRFLLQLMSETEDSWSNKTIVEEHDMNSNLGNSSYVASISNLNPGTYKVRLIAVNSIGAAEPVLLETTFTIRTEGKFDLFFMMFYRMIKTKSTILSLILVKSSKSQEYVLIPGRKAEGDYRNALRLSVSRSVLQSVIPSVTLSCPLHIS